MLAVGFLSAALATGGTYAAVRIGESVEDDSPGVVQSDSPADAPALTAEPATDTTDAESDGAPSPTAQGDWAAVAQAISPGVVSIAVLGQQGQGSGSGVVWDSDGHVVTNAHVVEGARLVEVTLADGRTYAAEVVGSDTASDLAVVRLQTVPDDLTPLDVGAASEVAVGDPVMAIGNPLGLSGTVTTGIVSALDRPVSTRSAGSTPGAPSVPVVTNAIQTSAAINPGNSGGALVNAAGELIGINSAIATLSQGPEGQGGSIGIGFAIPSDAAQRVADQLITTGRASHAFLGVGLSDGRSEVDGAILSGAQVEQVEPGSPADEAGLQRGDLVTAVDGDRVSNATALVGQVRERGADDTATLTIVRDGATQEAPVTFAARPDEG
ncbi:PDZ domain-containing protein [Ornithinimicrobium pratense]|uniref:PDZ domain-containing protein n=1 Tax=Ornithinimicrobium pratense TaxID=2593973 RepID=A0A5J6V8Y4_9MICO|nr:PDZ domain-containing protein [Ornithinimicrobium pratense]